MNGRTQGTLRLALSAAVAVLVAACGSSGTTHAPDAGPGADAARDDGAAIHDALAADAADRRDGGPIDAAGVGAVLEVRGCPAYAGAECVILFDHDTVGASQTRAVEVFNSGDAPLTIAGLAIVPSGPFVITTSPPSQLAPQSGATLAVSYHPTAAVASRASLVITSDAALSTVNPGGVRIEGAAGEVGCSADAECLLHEECPAGVCVVCVGATTPPCYDGTLYGLPYGNDCNRPMCLCPAGSYYVPGGTCAAAPTCGDGQPCEAPKSCDPNRCRQFPECESRPASAGFCL
ncbi:MAG TPA: hypothetical protein VGQ83_07285 [Polyangia bacterium]